MPRYKHTFAFETDNPDPQVRTHFGENSMVITGDGDLTLIETETVPDPVVLSWPRVTLSAATLSAAKDDFVLLTAHKNPEFFKTGVYLTGNQAREFGQAVIDFANQVDPVKNEEY